METMFMRIHPYLFFHSEKGQTVLETAILFVILVFAFIAMQVYLKRGIQGRLRSGADSIGEQYDPNATTSDFTMNHISNVTTTTSTVTALVDDGTGTMRNRLVTDITAQTHYDNSRRTGYETVAAP